jgi:hypothetical protein
MIVVGAFAETAAALMDAIAPGDVAGDKIKALALYEKLAETDEATKRLAEWDEQPKGDPKLEAARRAILPGMLLVESLYLQIVRQWPAIFQRKTPKDPDEVEKFPEVSGPHLPQIRPRGAPAAQDNAVGERYVYMSERNDIALGTKFCGDLFEAGFPAQMIATMAMGIAESFVQAEEIRHANVLATGRHYGPYVAGDGEPLFSAKHPYDGGVYSNVLEPPAELNEAAVEFAAGAISLLPKANGLKAHAYPKLLVVPIRQEFTAHRLMLKNKDRPRRYPHGYCVMDYLEDPDAWFLTTSLPGLFSMEWAPFRLDMRIEKSTLILEGSQSYTPGYKDPRAIFASFPKGG